METPGVQTPKDEVLWKLAKERAEFKKHLVSYCIINAFLWILWAVTNLDDMEFSGIPWPAYVTFFWGIGLAFNFFNAYVLSKQNLEEKEYQKLVNKQRGL